MKVNLEGIYGKIVPLDIDLNENCSDMIRHFLEGVDFETASNIIPNPRKYESLIKGDSVEERAAISLTTHEGDEIRCNWMIPICSQLDIIKEIERIWKEQQIPLFTIMAPQWGKA